MGRGPAAQRHRGAASLEQHLSLELRLGRRDQRRSGRARPRWPARADGARPRAPGCSGGGLIPELAEKFRGEQNACRNDDHTAKADRHIAPKDLQLRFEPFDIRSCRKICEVGGPNVANDLGDGFGLSVVETYTLEPPRDVERVQRGGRHLAVRAVSPNAIIHRISACLSITARATASSRRKSLA